MMKLLVCVLIMVGSTMTLSCQSPPDTIDELVSLMEQINPQLPPEASITYQSLISITQEIQITTRSNNLGATRSLFKKGSKVVKQFLSQIKTYPQLRPYYSVYSECLNENNVLNAKFDADEADFGDAIGFLQNLTNNLGQVISTSSGSISNDGIRVNIVNELVSLMEQIQPQLPIQASTTYQKLIVITQDIREIYQSNNLGAARTLFYQGSLVVAQFLSQIKTYPQLRPYYSVYSECLNENKVLNAKFDADEANFDDAIDFIQNLTNNLSQVISTSPEPIRNCWTKPAPYNFGEVVNQLVNLMQQLQPNLPPQASTIYQKLIVITQDIREIYQSNNLGAAKTLFYQGSLVVAQFLSQIKTYPQLRPYYSVYSECLNENKVLNAKFDADEANFDDAIGFIQNLTNNLSQVISTSPGPIGICGTKPSAPYNFGEVVNQLVNLMQQLRPNLPPQASTIYQSLIVITQNIQVSAQTNNLGSARDLFRQGIRVVSQFLSQIQNYPQLQPYYSVYSKCLSENEQLNDKFDADEADFGDALSFFQSLVNSLGPALSTSSRPILPDWSSPSTVPYNTRDVVNKLVSLMQQIKPQLPSDASITFQNLISITQNVQTVAYSNNLGSISNLFRQGILVVRQFLTQIKTYPQLRPYYTVYSKCLTDNEVLNAKFDSNKANAYDAIAFLQNLANNLNQVLTSSPGPISTDWTSTGPYSSGNVVNNLVSLMQQIQPQLPPEASTTFQNLIVITQNIQIQANNLGAVRNLFYQGSLVVAQFISQIQNYPQLRPFFNVYSKCLSDNKVLNAKFDANQANIFDGTAFLQNLTNNLRQAVTTSSGPIWTGWSDPTISYNSGDVTVNQVVFLLNKQTSVVTRSAKNTIQNLILLTKKINDAINCQDLNSTAQYFQIGYNLVQQLLPQLNDKNLYIGWLRISIMNQALNQLFAVGVGKSIDAINFLQFIVTSNFQRTAKK